MCFSQVGNCDYGNACERDGVRCLGGILQPVGTV